MDRGLRFFQSSVLQKSKSLSRRGIPKRYSLSDCTFLSLESLNTHLEPIQINFAVGDKTFFLGQEVTITKIALDSKNNVICQVQYNNGLYTFVHQELLENNNWNKEPIEEPFSNGKDNALDVPKSQGEKQNLESKGDISKTTNTVLDIAKKIEEKENLPASKKDTFVTLSTSSKQKSITVEELLKFIQFKDLPSSFATFGNVLKVYKFLVQNTCYDEAILKERVTTMSEENDISKKTSRLQLATQYILLMMGIPSHIVALQNRKDGAIHHALVVDIGDKGYFLDVELGRSFYEKENLLSLQLATLGLKECSKLYDILGLLPQDEEDDYQPLPSTIAKTGMSPFIVNGFEREIPDLTYTKLEETVVQKG